MNAHDFVRRDRDRAIADRTEDAGELSILKRGSNLVDQCRKIGGSHIRALDR
jgi:hypothetical protein